MFVAGCDYNTHNADFVILPWDGGAAGARWFRVPLRDLKVADELQAFDAACGMAEVLVPFIPWANIDVCFVEKPFVGLSRKTALMISRIQGAIIGAIPSKVAVSEIDIDTWKDEFTGNPKAEKTEVREKAIALGFDALRHGEDVFDAYDAFGIAWAARNQCRRLEQAAAASLPRF